MCMRRGSHARGHGHTRAWDCVDRSTGDITSVKMRTGHAHGCKCSMCTNPERCSLAENSEYFTSCQDPAEMASACASDANGNFAYAVDEFGAPGLDFKDWVTSQSVDPQVLKNHAEFVADRLGTDNPQNITGRTYSPDSHDSYDPIPWVGLRRPQAVAVCNPTQVSDVDYNLYETKPKFTWSSS
jgi:hypothetical protein